MAEQLNLLDPLPPLTARFDDRQVRAADPATRVSLGVAAALRDAAADGRDRRDVATLMGDLLGAPISVNALNACASPARQTPISAHRYGALASALNDRRLLELLAEPCGWTVIDRRMLRFVELAALHERQRELRREAGKIRFLARREGVL